MFMMHDRQVLLESTHRWSVEGLDRTLRKGISSVFRLFHVVLANIDRRTFKPLLGMLFFYFVCPLQK